MKKSCTLFFCAYPIVFLRISAQNRFLVSQYMYNGLVLNPAYAGSQQQLSLAALYRDQWLNIEGSPSFQMISTHTPVFSNTVGLGLLFSHEQIGIHKEYAAYLMFAYRIKLEFRLSLYGSFRWRFCQELRLCATCTLRAR